MHGITQVHFSLRRRSVWVGRACALPLRYVEALPLSRLSETAELVWICVFLLRSVGFPFTHSDNSKNTLVGHRDSF